MQSQTHGTPALDRLLLADPGSSLRTARVSLANQRRASHTGPGGSWIKRKDGRGRVTPAEHEAAIRVHLSTMPLTRPQGRRGCCRYRRHAGEVPRPKRCGNRVRCRVRGRLREAARLAARREVRLVPAADATRRSRRAVELLRRLVPRAGPLDDRQQLGSMGISLRLRRLLLE